VFVNWLMTSKTQTTIVKTVQSVNSLRLDVAPGLPDAVLDIKRIDQYIPHQYERLLSTRQRAEQLSNELLK
jgi:hypothetical protein